MEFDTPIDRRDTDSSKWRKYAGRDVIPMWVADMDFAAPPPVIAALRQRLDHGVFGYTDPWPSLTDAVVEGVARDHNWAIEADWIVWLPGMVSAFNIACRAVGKPGDGVFTATPVYPPFLTAPGFSERTLITRPLVRQPTGWQWDWDAVRSAMTPHTRLLMLCNPHNPVGRVFSRAELGQLATLAHAHDLVICSDEIHCGLVLDPDHAHIPIASLDEATAQRTITLMAPSKTWNIASLYCAFAVIPNPTLRRQYVAAMRGIVPPVNVLGLTATEAAYRQGNEWRLALIEYLRGNRDRLLSAVAATPGLASTPIEATYLAWIDCTALGIANPVAFFEQHGVGLSDGTDFGAPGFVGLNFGCPRARLNEAIARLQAAVRAG